MSLPQPARKLYDRRSLELSRLVMLETLAGGAPDTEDEGLADQVGGRGAME